MRLLRLGRAVDPDHPALPLLAGEARDHPGLRRAGDRAHDHGVEEDPERRLLLRHLLGPAREAEPAQRVIGGAGGDRVGRAAGRLDVGDRLLPALLEADPEARLHQPHVGAHEAAELDVADAVIDDVGPVDPALLHEHAAHPGARCCRRHLARVVGLDAADRDERVAALGARVGDQVLQLARLVAAVGEPAVAVVALGPHVGAAELRRQPLEPVHGRRPEGQREALEGVQVHPTETRPRAIPAARAGPARRRRGSRRADRRPSCSGAPRSSPRARRSRGCAPHARRGRRRR